MWREEALEHAVAVVNESLRLSTPVARAGSTSARRQGPLSQDGALGQVGGALGRGPNKAAVKLSDDAYRLIPFLSLVDGSR